MSQKKPWLLQTAEKVKNQTRELHRKRSLLPTTSETADKCWKEQTKTKYKVFCGGTGNAEKLIKFKYRKAEHIISYGRDYTEKKKGTKT